jgi:hypothetical protein
MHSPIQARDVLFALSLMLVASACGTKKTDGGGGEVKTVPRPLVDAGSASTSSSSCSEGDDCRAGQSCTGTCGVHRLGDSNCSCVDESISCTSCVLDPAFKGMLQDATEFCPASVVFGESCATKGATCIFIDSNTHMRAPCLCWKGKTGLEWDCDQDDPQVSTPGFFKDLAPPTPPPTGGAGDPPPPSGNRTRDAATPMNPGGPDAGSAP